MLIRISTVVACMFASAILAGESTLKHLAALVAALFCYAGAELAQHQAKRKREKEQKAVVKELGDLRLTEAALREEDRRKQGIIDEFHRREEAETQKMLSEVQEVCRKIHECTDSREIQTTAFDDAMAQLDKIVKKGS